MNSFSHTKGFYIRLTCLWVIITVLIIYKDHIHCHVYPVFNNNNCYEYNSVYYIEFHDWYLNMCFVASQEHLFSLYRWLLISPLSFYGGHLLPLGCLWQTFWYLDFTQWLNGCDWRPILPLENTSINAGQLNPDGPQYCKLIDGLCIECPSSSCQLIWPVYVVPRRYCLLCAIK